ncbi:G-type lectin S-receptor-like serine/threonine-protein kinase RKS1 [Bienertia sinuspersici]
MSPEYTIGHFSEKTDVYSFGLILFEIVGGRKNSTFHRIEQSLTLTGYKVAYVSHKPSTFVKYKLLPPKARQQRQQQGCLVLSVLAAWQQQGDPVLPIFGPFSNPDKNKIHQPQQLLRATNSKPTATTAGLPYSVRAGCMAAVVAAAG